MDGELEITYRRPDEIRPDPRNARTHSKKQVGQIVASISAFGFTNPILIDADGVVVAGHGRLQAAKRLKLERVPTICVAHLDDAERTALRLADNKIALNSGWDRDLLKIELGAVISAFPSLNIDSLGFSTGEIDLALTPPKTGDEDVIPHVNVEPVTKPGDIWTLGAHRIGCGDIRDETFLRQVLGPGEAVAAAFLDPPYNLPIQGYANPKSLHPEFAMASGEMDPAIFSAFIKAALSGCAAVSRGGAVHFVCIDWRHMDVVMEAGDAIYGVLLNLCVWNKSNAGMGSLYRSKHELIYVYRVGDAKHFNAVELGRNGRHRANVWDYPSVSALGSGGRADLALHPTDKPVAMIADALLDVTKRGDLVLDGFLGSGTSLLAAERIGRRLRGIEIDPGYVDLAVERWRDMTGLKPKLLRCT